MTTTFPTLDITKPDATVESITQMGQSTRDQTTWLRSALVSGTLFGYDLAISGGSADQPTTFLHSKGVEQIKEVVTWGTTGGASGNPQTIVYSYSSDTGATWDSIGTLTYSYDVNGNCTGGAWS